VDNSRVLTIAVLAAQTGRLPQAEAAIDLLPRIARAALSVEVLAAKAVARLRPVVHAEVRVWVLEVAAVVAVGGGGRKAMNNTIQKTARTSNSSAREAALLIFKVTLSCILTLFFSSFSLAQAKPSDTPSQSQKTFSSPKEAAGALISAAEKDDIPAMQEIFGPAGEDLLSTEDPVQDKNIVAEFVAEAHQKNSVNIDPKNPNRAILVIGNRDWPMPIPIVKKDGKWFFDTKAGRQEMLFRRIGANELDAIEICRSYVESQHEYAMERHDGSEVNQYAQKVMSTPGKHDGLVWRNPDGTLGGPRAEELADALAEGYTDHSKPFHGYYFKILKGQGPAAPLGKMDFVIEGAMIGGFALVAAPADYRVTGVKTFIVGYEGTVYQKDLGPDTLKIFKEMELYNPDKSWTRTNDSWPEDTADASSMTGQD
jgi:Protein of unknown function (DUF2950)